MIKTGDELQIPKEDSLALEIVTFDRVHAPDLSVYFKRWE
jgi:hypothetical protein